MIERQFADAFGTPPEQTAYAPGRVNLLGEHIDYNGGTVLPMALPIGLSVAMRARRDDTVRIASDRFDGIENRRIVDGKTGQWADYASGAVAFAVKQGLLPGGADLLVQSSIPDGAGLSSSAALIVATLKAARQAAGSTITDVEIAVLARHVENDYIGMPCGIMDQMAVAVAQAGQAIALDTKSLDYAAVVVPKDWRMAVIHSGEHRKLSDGRYAERRRECDRAAQILGNPNLCLLNEREQGIADSLPAPLGKRVRHCLSEHRRVLTAVGALHDANMNAFGALMNESHVSMRDDFEMSTLTIDALVADAVDLGAVGARLTGGGFGGCIVAAVREERLEAWTSALLDIHQNARFIA